MLTKKKWALFSLLTLCGGTIYKLPSLKDAFYPDAGIFPFDQWSNW